MSVRQTSLQEKVSKKEEGGSTAYKTKRCDAVRSQMSAGTVFRAEKTKRNNVRSLYARAEVVGVLEKKGFEKGGKEIEKKGKSWRETGYNYREQTGCV